MRVRSIGPNGTLVVLSRRNLESLLAKLDGHPPGSACTIMGGDEAPGYAVMAEEDEDHYSDRQAGEMHPHTQQTVTIRRLSKRSRNSTQNP